MGHPGATPATKPEPFLRSVDNCIRALIDVEVNRWTADNNSIMSGPAMTGAAHRHTRDLFADLRAAACGGKRLRPTFCYWGFVGASGRQPGAKVVRMAAALELLHTFAVIHDDVMDGSATRRGRSSVHARLAERHRLWGWRGERRRFSEGGAVLVGDLAFALAHLLATEFPPVARSVWHRMCAELVVGQHLDMRGSASGERDARYAAIVASLKSASYTVIRPLLLGAAMAPGDSRAGLERCYTNYGRAAGVAFQLRDDLLGVFGDVGVTGKPAGEDLREGRPTMLLSIAAERATPAQHRLLERAGRDNLTDAEIDAIADVCRHTEADVEVELQIKLAVEQALLTLQHSPIRPPADAALRQLAQRAAWRHR